MPSAQFETVARKTVAHAHRDFTYADSQRIANLQPRKDNIALGHNDKAHLRRPLVRIRTLNNPNAAAVRCSVLFGLNCFIHGPITLQFGCSS
jgi:hypothetical protein